MKLINQENINTKAKNLNKENQDFNVTAQIADKLDGLVQLHLQVPIVKIDLNEIMSFTTIHSDMNTKAFFQRLRKHFAKN